jgi:16S rRNA (guanine527-N7)-methyltransferase
MTGVPAPDVSRETHRRLDVFAALLRRWSPRINLVSAADLPHLWSRHIEDCLQLLPCLPAGIDRGIDLGSGAGFPGLILALASGIPFDLIEADQRKAAFLREAVRETGTPAHVHAVRIEAASLPPAPLVTARALAPLDRLLALASPLLAPGGTFLFLKGRDAERELTEAGRQWHMQVTRVPSRTHPDASILEIRDPRRAPKFP